MSLYIATALVAYLLGSIPFGYILVRAFRGGDIRESGSGNIGATNVARSSPALGALTLLLDAIKGLLAVIAGSLLAASAPRDAATRPPLYAFAAIAAICAVLGHIFPIWLKFRGGKGVATSIGVFVALTPKTLLVALAVFIGIFAAFRYVSLASIVAAALFPLIAYGLRDYHSSPTILAAICIIAALVILQHRDNIRRLVSGTENRFVLRKTRA